MRRILFTVALAATGIAGFGGSVIFRARPPAGTEPASARLDEAIAYFERALARDTLNPMFKGQLIHRLILRFGLRADLADLRQAEELARSAVALAPNRSAALARLSGVLLMQHQFAPAMVAAEAAVAADSGSRDARGALLEAALAAGRYDVADRLATQLDQASVASLVWKAAWLDARGQSETALELLSRACRELDRSGRDAQIRAWCLTQLAGIVHTTQGSDAAERVLRSALAIVPDYRGAIEGLASLALARGDAGEAVAGFQSIRSDAHPDLYLRLAEGYRQSGQTDRAAAEERRFLALAGTPENEALFGNTLALYYAERGEPSVLGAALEIARREVARRPTNESYDLLGWVHYRRGEYTEAWEAAAMAGRWGSLSATMRYHRGKILTALGRGVEGAELVAEATADPSVLSPHALRDWKQPG